MNIYSLLNSKFYYNILVFLVISFFLFTYVSEIYYIYIHNFHYTRCGYFNNNDKSKCISRSDMRNFLYDTLFN